MFFLAGMFWLVIYGFRWANTISAEELTMLRSAQSPIYFVLMTLWGIGYLRQAARLRLLAAIGNAARKPINEITLREIPESKLHLLGELYAITTSLRAYVMPTFNLILLVLTGYLVVAQYTRAVSLLLR